MKEESWFEKTQKECLLYFKQQQTEFYLLYDKYIEHLKQK